MDHPVISPKKLIEVALPLDAINLAAKEEKSVPRRGHPQTLHLWWARRPLAAARAVIFSQLVNDPEDLWRCQNPGKEPNAQVKGHWTKSRARLFLIIEDLVKWENTTNEQVLEKARQEIRNSWCETCGLNKDHPQASDLFNPDKLPGLHDPFAGGGTIPLEAQRLGFEALATDLNPVAVLINKAMIEIPPRFAEVMPQHPSCDKDNFLLARNFKGTQGLAEDVRYYGQWMRDEAIKRIGHHYPQFEVTKDMAESRTDLESFVGKKLTVIAWIWARTVKSPSPAFRHIDVPLASTFLLSMKERKNTYLHPVISKDNYRFEVRVGNPPDEAKMGTTAGKRAGFRCLMSHAPLSYEYIRDEGQAGRIGQKLMAVVVETSGGRMYLSPTQDHELLAKSVEPHWRPDLKLHGKVAVNVPLYGINTFGDLFTSRQLEALATFGDLVTEARDRIRVDAIAAGLPDDDISLEAGGTGAKAYAEGVSVYLACALSRLASYNNANCFWNMKGGSVAFIFSRQAIAITWDFIEINPLEKMSGNWDGAIEWVADVVKQLPAYPKAFAAQADAAQQIQSSNRSVCTDPPYYDNIGYADLSDFFYVWLRQCLRSVFPSLFATIAVPKAEELVATPYVHGDKLKASKFFIEGMTKAMRNIALQSHAAIPIAIYYAFKQSDTVKEGTNSSGWETFLEAVLKSGLSITGTWPMRTERPSGVKVATNALASSIVLVCRSRPKNAATISRRQFARMLNEALPLALDAMTREGEGVHSPVAPVDLSQAIIGPGMAIFSRYSAVLEADGSPMSVRTALQLINRFLAEDDFDADTQFCLHWFEQYGWETGKFGEADTLARAKGTSVDGVKQAGVLQAAGGNVRLLKWAEYPSDWDPQADQRLPIWEVLHQLIRVFNTDGETGAAAVFAAVQSKAEAARQLAYRLYTLCERKNWAEDARAYNEVVTSWSGIESAAAKEPTATQRTLFE